MYQSEDIDIINSKLDSIINKSYDEYKKHYEPTTTEISKVYASIKKYIIQKKFKVYGGFAQNILLMDKNPKASIYKIVDGAFYNWPDIADIEFYTPNPIKDLVDLADELYKQGYKYIKISNGIHEGTYKLFVNFLNYCDVTYMPLHVYNNLKTIDVNGIMCTHPHFMVCDAYRVLTDPLTSYWRLNKAMRFNTMLNYYPIGNDSLYTNLKFGKVIPEVMKSIRKHIVMGSNLIVVGFYSYDYYSKKINKEEHKEYPYYEIITDSIVKTSKKIHKLLNIKYKGKITVKQYVPFFQFTDKRVEFYYNNNLVLRLYGNNSRCTVYKFSERKKTYFGTYNLTYMYLLFNYIYNQINRNNEFKDLYYNLMSNLFILRNKYLSNHKITVIDDSPFQDFTFKCTGDAVDTLRSARLANANNKIQRFNYTASGNKITIPTVNYDNISGNQITDSKNFFYKFNQ
jgi:hypothetical protein